MPANSYYYDWWHSTRSDVYDPITLGFIHLNEVFGIRRNSLFFSSPCNILRQRDVDFKSYIKISIPIGISRSLSGIKHKSTTFESWTDLMWNLPSKIRTAANNMWPVASKWTCWWYDSNLSYWYQFKEHILSFKMVHRWRKSDFGNSRYEFKKHIYSYYFLYISRTLLAYISKQCLPTTCPFWRDGSHMWHDQGKWVTVRSLLKTLDIRV